MRKVLLIVPAFNEEKSIVKTIDSILKTNLDYIIINDGSTDETSHIISSKQYNHINLPVNLGIGGAVQTGYKYAALHDYDIAVQVDADGQHNIEYLDDLIQPIIDKKANLVSVIKLVSRRAKNEVQICTS